MEDAMGWIQKASGTVAACAFLLAGCGKNCGDEARLGDFEYSQNNYPNALRHYEKALKTDPQCGEGRVKEKLEETRKRL
jgi:hypothetical protein